MTTAEIAREIITATTLHFQNSLVTGLTKKGDGEFEKAINNMRVAEEKLLVALDNFKQLILKEAE
jgi:cellobiose-specific phosphotransferase system component IIA